MTIQHNVCLKSRNSFGFAAVADNFVEVNSEEDLAVAVSYAQVNQLAILPLGGGSNILVADRLSNALVVHMNLKQREVQAAGAQVEIRLGAGENWHGTVAWSVEQGLIGIETLALIPGQVGAAPVQNIGAYGTELKDVLRSVRAFDLETGTFLELTNTECEFAYRDSLFKRNPRRYLITSVTLLLTSTEQKQAAYYSALAQYFAESGISNPSQKEVFQAVCTLRRSKLPDPKTLGNAGSFFKNPVVTESHYLRLKDNWPNIVAYPILASSADSKGEEKGFKLAAGWLIDQCGWKGHTEGPVGVYEKQALVLVNHGDGSLTDLMRLASRIQQSVFEQFSVELEIEPQLFG